MVFIVTLIWSGFMAPPAISAIHCHLRWQGGSPWHWPLADLAFSRGPADLVRNHGGFSHQSWSKRWCGRVAGRMVNNGGIWLLLLHALAGGEEGRGGGGGYPAFCLPLEAGEQSAPGPRSLRLPPLCLPPFHPTSRNKNRRHMWHRGPFLCRKYLASCRVFFF